MRTGKWGDKTNNGNAEMFYHPMLRSSISNSGKRVWYSHNYKTKIDEEIKNEVWFSIWLNIRSNLIRIHNEYMEQ